jgi:hypothetical protein
MQKLLNEWRAYIREDREAKKPAKPYNITDIQCRTGVSGVGRHILTRKGRKFVEFCPQRSDSQAVADMETHKRGIEEAFLKIRGSNDAFDALAYLENIDHPSWRYYEPLLDPNLKLGDYIAKYDPFAPDTNFIFFQPTDITKENYNKRFDSIMRNVYGVLNPFNNMSPELKKDTDLQKKLDDLYKAVLRFYRHIKEYHKARIAQ